MEQPAWRDEPQSKTSLTWPELDHLMEQAGPILEQIRNLPREPLANHGLSDKTPVFDLIVLSHWLTIATVVVLHHEDRASALQNLDAVLNLAQVSREEPDLICQIGRSAVIRISVRPTWEALQYPDWKEPELCRLQAAWESVTPLSAAELGLKGDLAAGSDWDEAARKLPPNEPLEKRISWPFYLMIDAPSDLLFCLSYRWDGLQVARALGRQEPWTVLKPQAQLIQTRLLKMANSKSRHWIPRENLPKSINILEDSVRNETGRQLLLTDIAIHRFRLRHNGAAPNSLMELIPDFLKQPSRDPMTGKQLLYRSGTDGSDLLYAAGEDGVDDGGDPTPIDGNPPGLFNGRDMVWPTGVD